jgi:hypothetical protein
VGAGAASVDACKRCSTGSKVGNAGWSGGSAQFNGGTAVSVGLPATGSATAVATKTLGLALTAGSNVIRLKGASSAAVGIDRLSVVR